jgi:hypothetical protein
MQGSTGQRLDHRKKSAHPLIKLAFCSALKYYICQKYLVFLHLQMIGPPLPIQSEIYTFLMKRNHTLVAVVVLVVVSALTPALAAEEAALTDIVVTNTRDDLLLYLNITNCFNEDMREAINNGINTTFNFFIRLYEVRDFGWDQKLADLKVSHEIHYDSLKKEYKVRLSEKDNKVVTVKDLDEAKRLMSEIVGLEVAKLDQLQRGNRYQIRMMAELDKIRLPFYLHYVFFFLSLWDFETDWYSVDFRY